jgi:hypothetical protein
MTNPPILPVVPGEDRNENDDIDEAARLGGDEPPVDPDVDANQVDSADADRRAVTEGTKDSDRRL